MALSLPYDLTFAPLDVLTAEEMNEIVQNYTTIAQAFPIDTENILGGSITNAKIADQAITSSKLNYSSVFQNITQSHTLNTNVSQSYATVDTINIAAMPVGAIFFAILKMSFSGTGTDTGVFTRLRYGSVYGSVGQCTNPWGRSLDSWGIFTKNTTNQMYVEATKDNSTEVIAVSDQFAAFRIA